MRRSHRVAIDAACLYFPAPASLDGIVDADHHLAARRQHRQKMEQQSTRHVAGIPARPVEHFVVAAETGLSASPMTRSAWVTVRLPGARTAPPTNTKTWFQTGALKHGSPIR